MWVGTDVLFDIRILQTIGHGKNRLYKRKLGVVSHFQNVPWKAGFLVLKGQKMRPPCNSKTKSRRSELNWLLKYLITPNVCAKFQPNRLTTTFGPGTFSQTMTLKDD